MAVFYTEKNKICISTGAWSFRLWVKAIEKSFFNNRWLKPTYYHLYIINYRSSQCIRLIHPHSSVCVIYERPAHTNIPDGLTCMCLLPSDDSLRY